MEAKANSLLPGSSEFALHPESVRSPSASLALWCGIGFLAAAGCLGIFREINLLWALWTGDPLRSIGMLIPPVSIVLTLRVWRQQDWKLRGTWWGLAVIGLAFVLSFLRQDIQLFAVVGNSTVSFIPQSLPVYLYACGVVLLFAGPRVWLKAWFPLGLLLLSQPVPSVMNGLVDLPLQNVSAHVARSFATFIHFTPTTPQLRLMFSPDFGMFIAPGCDGIRGAVTMGYVALLLGYLKRLSFYRWIAYVAGAVLLGYLFNFLRLCVLVVYYRVALGHPMLENIAKQADYAIGSCLFLVAMLIFLWIANRKQQSPATLETAIEDPGPSLEPRSVLARAAIFALVLLTALALPSSALRFSGNQVRTPAELAALMPKQIGEFKLTRAWYEQQNGTIVEENGAYSAPGSDEIILGVWVAPLFHLHNAQQCWLARGLQPDFLTTKPYTVAGGQSVAFTTGFYGDGVTDSIVVNAACTPGSCPQFSSITSKAYFGLLFLKPEKDELAGSGTHPVSIMLRIDKLHSGVPETVTYSILSAEAGRFLSGLNPTGLSRSFQ